MTCIAGIVKNEKVYMVADSVASNGYSNSVCRNPKIFKKGGYLIGYTSSFRMGQIIEHKIKLPKPKSGKITMSFMCNDFIESIKKGFKDGGYMMKGESGDDMGGCFMVGYKNRLFVIYSDFQVYEPDHPYMAVGSGSDVAMGCLYMINESILPNTGKINEDLIFDELYSVIGCCSRFVSTVQLPAVIMSTKNK